ncbi:MAG: hypothetical protein IKG91_08230 [Firmicutes bacterium]|nr:hypothetical protein [Bacillota bacterium]
MKRRLSFFFAAFFAAMVILSSLPQGLLKVKAAPTPIVSVFVSPELPAVGGSYSGPVPASLAPAVDSPFTIISAYWFNGANQESGGIGLAPSTFLPGGLYFIEFVLRPKDGYEFTSSTAITVEGTTVEAKSLDSISGELLVSTGNFQLKSEEISDVSAKLDIPGIGGYWSVTVPADVQLPDGARYSLYDSYWFNAKDQASGTEGSSPTVFDAGLSYYAVLYFAADSGYAFSSDPSIDLENASIETWEVLPSGYLYIKTKPITLTWKISIVFMTLTVPSAGGAYAGVVKADVKPDKDEHFTIKDAYWYNAEDQESGEEDDPPRTFSPGGKYYAQFTLVPEEGYSFIYGTSIGLEGAEYDIAILQEDGTIIIVTEPITIPGSSSGSSESSNTSGSESSKTDSGEKSGESSSTSGESSGGESSGSESSGNSSQNSGSSQESSAGTESSAQGNQGDTKSNTPASPLSNIMVILLAVMIPLLIAVIVIIIVLISKNKTRR